MSKGIIRRATSSVARPVGPVGTSGRLSAGAPRRPGASVAGLSVGVDVVDQLTISTVEMAVDGVNAGSDGASPHTGRCTLIGGPARVGKSTLARRWAAAHPHVEVVHLDHLLHAAAAVAAGDVLSALRSAPSVATHSPQQWLAALRERDAVLWAAARAYVGAAADDALIMEGGLWPDWVGQLDRPHDAIFVVDTSPDMADRLIHLTRTDPRSWMAQRRWSEPKIRTWATYNRFRSEVVAELADRHGYRVFDISAGIAAVQDHALRHLAATTAARDEAEIPSPRVGDQR